MPDRESYQLAIDKVVLHPNYKDLYDDLSLMRLARRVEFNEHVQPVCLDPRRSSASHIRRMRCVNVGYGLLEEMMQAVKLQKIEVTVLEPRDCMSESAELKQVRPRTLCIGPPEGKIGGSCFGDSGGPNHCYDAEVNRWFLVGTVSYGPAICDREEGAKWLTVSVNVSSYDTWISSTMLQNGD